MTNIEILEPLIFQRLSNIERNNIAKLKSGFITNTFNNYIEQTLAIVNIHALDYAEYFNEEDKAKIVDMSNRLVYE